VGWEEAIDCRAARAVARGVARLHALIAVPVAFPVIQELDNMDSEDEAAVAIERA
jgi:hypothetical protein